MQRIKRTVKRWSASATILNRSSRIVALTEADIDSGSCVYDLKHPPPSDNASPTHDFIGQLPFESFDDPPGRTPSYDQESYFTRPSNRISYCDQGTSLLGRSFYDQAPSPPKCLPYGRRKPSSWSRSSRIDVESFPLFTQLLIPDNASADSDRLSRLPRELNDRIPLEIVWQVIDWLVSDNQSLLDCALVSHACFEYCMGLLYTDIVISRQGTFSLLAQSGYQHAAVRERLSLTRSLQLDGGNIVFAPDGENDGERNSPRRPISVESISPGALLTLCPSLECLAFRNCTAAPAHHTFFRSLRLCTSVTELTLANVTFSNFCDLQRAISCLPRLHRLELEGISYPSHKRLSLGINLGIRARGPSHSSVLSQLGHLCIGSNLPGDILFALVDWLIATPAICEGIHTLEVWQTDSYLSSINRLLQAIGPSLLNMHERSKVAGKEHPHFDLRHNTRLRRLHSYIESLEEAPVQDTLLPFLSTVHSNHLEEIKLSMCFGLLFSTSFEARVAKSIPDPGRLAPLQRSVFATLRSVVLDIRLGWYAQREDLFLEQMRMMLAPWHARGILTVERTVGLF
ncbi:uncharacterized protein B0H18DRAFT_1121027 [Fomitopsis serialis]|uniref:uncharacterized protein n=1 Tax=Fomitopsis serialis TaxID=139415 RepID=UPI0020079D75|nr:uncharacterized protein B0H18DRAFT_1121027 [Neoantrodia serialis]KAH9922205.1 hypothetical protein B0H18DRAFT_1121027 [Neoantrodia serialis]